MVLDPPGRKAAEAVFEALLAYVGVFTQDAWDSISAAEDALIEVINNETRDDGGRGR